MGLAILSDPLFPVQGLACGGQSDWGDGSTSLWVQIPEKAQRPVWEGSLLLAVTSGLASLFPILHERVGKGQFVYTTLYLCIIYIYIHIHMHHLRFFFCESTRTFTHFQVSLLTDLWEFFITVLSPAVYITQIRVLDCYLFFSFVFRPILWFLFRSFKSFAFLT